MRNKIMGVVVIFVIAAGVYAFLKNKEMQVASSPWAADKNLLLAAHTDISYQDFLDDLQNTCPYYEPDGATYRDCLSNLLTEREKEVDTFQTPELKSLSGMWKPYRDTLCEMRFASNTGSNQGGFVNTCRIYETERYLQILHHLKMM